MCMHCCLPIAKYITSNHFLCNITFVVIVLSMEKSLKYTKNVVKSKPNIMLMCIYIQLFYSYKIFMICYRPVLLSDGLWDQIRVDCGREFALILFVQQLLSSYRTNVHREPYLQTKQVIYI